MATQQDAPDQQIDVTAAEWLMIIVTGFTGVFLGPVAIIPGALLLGMFTYRVNPELMQASKAGQWVRGLLPAPAPASDEQDTPSAPSTPPAPPSGLAAAPAVTGAIVAAQPVQVAACTLAMIDVETLARCSTILLVGSRGSGKSTLLRAILAAKTEVIAVYDPHAHPQAWPMATMLHNTEQAISTGLASAYKRLIARRHEMRTGVRIAGWPKFTLAADEWGSIVSNVELPESVKKTPGEVSTELMKEGRKFDIGFVAGAHGFTNKSLGCTGDQEAFMQSFDWIVNMGGFTRKMLAKNYAELFAQIPMGTNEQGGTFPLIVVCESPTTGELRLLDLRGLTQTVDTPARPVVPIVPWATPQPSADDGLLAGLLAPLSGDIPPVTRDTTESQSDTDATAAQSDATSGDMATVAPVTPAEIAQITMSLSQGKSVSQTARAMKGYNGRTHKAYMVKVEYVKALLDAPPPQEDVSAADNGEQEPPEWFGKAFGE